VILIPEIKTVVILTPRTGSGSTKRAIAEKYPKSILLYRHMEADGLPQGYDRWEKVGVVRNPVERLWSLYKFMQSVKGEHLPQWLEAMRKCVDMPFDQWVTENHVVFTSPYDPTGGETFYPEYTVRHPLPENKKSQFLYLRPDLGTTVFQFNNLEAFAERLGIELETHNGTEKTPIPSLTGKAKMHINSYFKWDLTAAEGGE